MEIHTIRLLCQSFIIFYISVHSEIQYLNIGETREESDKTRARINAIFSTYELRKAANFMLHQILTLIKEITHCNWHFEKP